MSRINLSPISPQVRVLSAITIAIALAIGIMIAVHHTMPSGAGEGDPHLKVHLVATLIAAWATPLAAVMLSPKHVAKQALVAIGMCWAFYIALGFVAMYVNPDTYHRLDFPAAVFGFGTAVLCSIPRICVTQATPLGQPTHSHASAVTANPAQPGRLQPTSSLDLVGHGSEPSRVEAQLV